jgi:hypothetical protein
MKNRATLCAFIALCLLGAGAWLVEHRFRSTDEQAQQAATLLQIVPANITFLSMTRGDLQLECIKRSERWFLRNPQDAPIADGKIETILRLLATVSKGAVISLAELRDQDLTPDDYGLATPQARFVLGDDHARQELWVGAEATLGDTLYATVQGSDEIVTIFRGLVDLIPEQVDDLRDRRLFSIPAEKVGYVCFQQDGARLVLAKGVSGWVITEPVQCQADERIIGPLLAQLTALRATSFINEPITNASAMGLAPPVGAIHLAEDARRIEATGPDRLLIGRLQEGTETVFARYGAKEFTCEISSRGLNALMHILTNPLAYASRTMLQVPAESICQVALLKHGSQQIVTRKASSEWTSVLPLDREVNPAMIRDILMFAAELRALRVETLAPGDLSLYGLHNPWAVLALGLRDDPAMGMELRIGSRAEGGGRYAMIKEQASVFVLAEVFAELLTRSLVQAIDTDRPD